MAHDETIARSILAALSRGSASLSPLGNGLASDAWLVRWPKGDTALRVATYPEDPVTYPMEHALMLRLRTAGAAVPEPITGSWRMDAWDGPAFSLTSFLPGTTLQPDARVWAHEPIARFLRTLHSLEVIGAGPLVEVDGALRGAFDDRETGTIEAWSGAPLWPFGGTSLDRHPALAERPALARRMDRHRDTLRTAVLDGPFVVVHSDLHEENILQAERGLSFIDFGVAFVGAPGWDFAALAYFLGWDLADRTLDAYLATDDADEAARWRRSVALIALSLGARRWEQDRQNELDEDVHDETFLVETLDRLGP
jgi:Ser/Thr protein kinase RdoA (MazF antagonist)